MSYFQDMTITTRRPYDWGPHGLGTSAVHLGTATGTHRQPKFHLPFPAQMSPDVERARRQGLVWARTMGIVENARQAAALDAPRYDRLAAGAYPLTWGEDLDLPVQWMLWFFSFDDAFDGPLGTDPAAVDGLIDLMVALMYAGHPPEPAEPPLLRGFLDLCRRSVAGSPPSWLTYFYSDVEVYLRSYQWEAANRARRGTPTTEVYLEMRRHSIGVWMSLDLVERAGHFTLPHPAWRTEAIQTMRRLCSDVIVMINDVYSAAKDRDHQNLNLVTLLRDEEGTTTAEAITRVEEQVADRVRDYQRLEAGLDQLHHDLHLAPAARTDLHRYAHGMRSWMRSNLDWSIETVRYREKPAALDWGSSRHRGL